MSTHVDIAPGYALDAELSPGTFRCLDPAGRRWVLKRLPDDCRHADGIHPAIRERLARVRDVAHARVATLATVVRGAGDPYLVWAHVDGTPLDQLTPTPDQFPPLARNLASAVETLHARGLVHGALTPGNVIVTPAGDVWLTHVSPYLWTDPADDARAVADLLRPIAAALSLPPPDPSDTLQDLAHRWSTPPEFPAEADAPDRRPLWAAVAVTLVAVALAVTLARWAQR
jgi:hypothetical protein